jgi:hypothetical protein
MSRQGTVQGKLAANPFRSANVAGNDHPIRSCYLHDIARRKVAKMETALKFFKLDPNRDDRCQAPILALDPACNGTDPSSGCAPPYGVTHSKRLTGKDFLKEVAITKVGPANIGIEN